MENMFEKRPSEGELGRSEGTGPEKVLKKLKQLPRFLRASLGGLGLLAALGGEQELASQDIRWAPAPPRTNVEYRLPPATRESFRERFQISVSEKETSRFVVVVTTNPKNFEKIFLGSDLLVSFEQLRTGSPEAWGLFEPAKKARINELRDFLERKKRELGSMEFAIDSVEVKGNLGQEDYYQIMEKAFGESLDKILAIIDTVKTINSPEKKRRMPKKYGIKGLRTAYHTERRGYSIIGLEQTYLREETNLRNEAQTFLHELGHAFDPASPYGIDGNGIVRRRLEERGRTPLRWKIVMMKDKAARGDTSETIFYYPRRIKDSDSRATEDFAESFASYFINSKWLFENAPNRFMAIDEMMKFYLDDPNWNIFERSENLRAYLERIQKDSRDSFYATASQIAQNIR